MTITYAPGVRLTPALRRSVEQQAATVAREHSGAAEGWRPVVVVRWAKGKRPYAAGRFDRALLGCPPSDISRATWGPYDRLVIVADVSPA